MKKAVLIYNLLLASIITLVGLVNAKTPGQLLFSLAFLPVAIFFALKLFRGLPRQNSSLARLPSGRQRNGRFTSSPKPAHLPQSSPALEPEVLTGEKQARVLNRMGVSDADRRIFLKFLGSSSMALFILAIFTKQARAAFFGSIPGPGSVSVKDSSGAIINPAEKQATDGYEVAEIDDTTYTDTYYGFTNKEGAWYITQESSTGSYRYVRGSSGFSANWTLRDSLSYDTFDNVF